MLDLAYGQSKFDRDFLARDHRVVHMVSVTELKLHLWKSQFNDFAYPWFCMSVPFVLLLSPVAHFYCLPEHFDNMLNISTEA